MQKLTAVLFFALLIFNPVSSLGLIRDPSGAIYLIMNYMTSLGPMSGKRWIPEPATFYNLCLDY